MALGGCLKCVKFFMLACNLIIFCIGFALLGYGIWSSFDTASETFVGGASEVSIGTKIYIGLGVLMVISSIIGCCGTFRNNPCLLMLFFVCCLLAFGFLMFLGILTLSGIAHMDEYEKLAAKSLDKAVRQYRSDKSSRELMDYLQVNFMCCGSSNGVVDYGGMNPPPESCKKEYRDDGCVKAVAANAKRVAVLFGGVSIGIAIFMFIIMIFSICLCCGIRKSERAANAII